MLGSGNALRGVATCAKAMIRNEMQTKPSLTLADAQRIAAAVLAKAAAEGWPISVAVVDDGANLLHFARMDGAKLGGIWTAIEKARSSVLFGRPTKALEDIVASGRNAMLNLPNAVPIQGGLPVTYEQKLVGGIGVSGVTSPQDEEAAAAGLAVL
jgi:glc operon protein GlcG